MDTTTRPGLLILFGGWNREETVIRLQESGYNIVAVVTPCKPSAKLQKSIERITATGLHVVPCDKDSLHETLTQLEGSILVSIGFRYLLDKSLLERYKYALNVHPTLLPRYRGPTPLAYVIMNHEVEAGSTVHLIDHGMDTGPIVLQRAIKISSFDTVRSMQRKVYGIEPELVIDALKLLETPGFTPAQQDESLATSYPKRRHPDDSEIDPNRPLLELYDMIRACDPDEYPAFFYFEGQKICIRLWRSERPPEDDAEML